MAFGLRSQEITMPPQRHSRDGRYRFPQRGRVPQYL
jgi:hypothetical protein